MSPKASTTGGMTADEFIQGRRKLGLSQEDLAHELGMTASAINRYENGRRVIPKKIELALRYLLSRRRRQT